MAGSDQYFFDYISRGSCGQAQQQRGKQARAVWGKDMFSSFGKKRSLSKPTQGVDKQHS